MSSRYSACHLLRHILRVLILIIGFASAGIPATASAQTVRVLVDGASIWSAPSVPSNVLTTVRAGTTLEVIERIGTWYRVRLPNDATRVGFILARQVEPSGPENPRPTQPRTAQSRPSTAARRRGPPRRAFLAGSGAYPPSALQFD